MKLDNRMSSRRGSVIHLCFITDETYVLPTAVAVESLKVNKLPEAKYQVHIICRNVSEAGMRRMQSVSSDDVQVVLYPDAQLPVDEAKVQLVRHVSTAALFKFFIPDFLPSLDKVIYLDSDILIQGDLTELWQTNVRRYYAAVVKDSQSVIGWEKHLKWLGFKERAYFNSGVMLLNLDLMRRNGLSEKLMDYRIRGKNRFMDQDALNVVFGCRVKYVSYRYNCLNWLFVSCTIPQLKELFGAEIRDSVEENLDHAIVLHIGGSEKPWLRDLPYYTEVYCRYSDRIGWSFAFPKVSVVVPVFNAARHLRQCLDSIRQQTLRELDIICVDNGSTDDSPAILSEYATKDSRIRLFKVEKKGAGCCRNFGINRARGEYVGFVDADDFIDRNYYSHLYGRAKDSDADMCMTALVCECNAKGEDIRRKRMGVDGLTETKSVRDRGALILASGVTWNKIYRNAFLTAHKLHYSEGACAGEDKIFAYTTLFLANSVPIIRSTAYHYRQSESSTAFKLKGRESFAIVGFYGEVREAIHSVAMPEADRQIWLDVIRRGRDAEFNLFARRMQPELRQEFKCRCVEAFCERADAGKTIDGLIVSLTSYPARIATVHHTIRSILGQSYRPREVVLWLAESQFPGKERDLPVELNDLVGHGLVIRWCEDLRSYKKLIPALRQYPEDCIVTADDDLIYVRYWLEKLWKTHEEHPDCVVYHRARRIEMSWSPRPYSTWKIITKSTKKDDALVFPTTGGGILYPPHVFKDEVFNQDAFMTLTPYADDVWFWAMVLLSERRFVQVDSYEATLNFTPGTQEETLADDNVGGGRNDQQLKAILARYPQIRGILRLCWTRCECESLLRLCGVVRRSVSDVFRIVVALRPSKVVKGVLPYGLVCFWFKYFRDVEEDKPLLHYHGVAKRFRRMLKFLLPYGLVDVFKRYKTERSKRWNKSRG